MQQGRFNGIDSLGRRLSMDTHCVIRYNDQKETFVCGCGASFPLGKLSDSQDWTWVREEHSKWSKK